MSKEITQIWSLKSSHEDQLSVCLYRIQSSCYVVYKIAPFIYIGTVLANRLIFYLFLQFTVLMNGSIETK